MIRNPEELTTAIKSAVNRRAVLLSHLVLFVTIGLQSILWPSTTPSEMAITIFICGGLIIMLFMKAMDLARLNNHPLVSIISYWVLIYVGISFLSEPATPYLMGGFLGVYMANLYYGAKGVYATVAVMAAATITKYFYLSAIRGLTIENRIDIFAGFFVFAAICSFFVNLQTVYDWDRKRLKSLIKEATIEQKRLRTLINSMTESVLVMDKDGRVKLANKAAMSLFNTNNSLNDKLLDDFANLEDTKGKKVSLDKLLPVNDKPVSREDLVLRYGKDDLASVSATITQMHTKFSKNDAYTGYIMTLRDITRQKSLEDEHNEFISVISHELRTPVTVTEGGIAAALKANENQGGNEEIKKMLTTAHGQALYLAGILNDLTTFARSEGETLDLKLEPVNPRDILNHLKDAHNQDAADKGLELKLNIDKNISSEIISNQRYVQEILQNFVTNAIKYSESGVVTISAEPAEVGLTFSVSDQGIGISTSDQKKIFDKFFRSEDYRTRSNSGTGLGLYVARKLIQTIEAELEVESEVGKGSTFRIVVPDLKHKQQELHQQLIMSNIDPDSQEPAVELAPVAKSGTEVSPS